MITKNKKIQGVGEVTIYVSEDGREFYTQQACEKWETDKSNISYAIEQLPHIDISDKNSFLQDVVYEDEVWVVKPRNLDDIDTINHYGEVICKDNPGLTEDYIGKLIVLDIGFYNKFCDVIVIQDYMQNMRETYKNYEEELDKKLEAE